MAKNLFLIRHAYAKEASRGDKDVERILSSQGVQDASNMGKFLSKIPLSLDAFFTSHAFRAKATATLIAEQIKFEGEVVENEELYEATARTMMNFINVLDDHWQTVFIVGHNPTITYLAEYIAKDEIGNVEPCGVVHLRFDLDSWAEVSQGNGVIKDYYIPGNID
jgi:phosphohistidine phosphatase